MKKQSRLVEKPAKGVVGFLFCSGNSPWFRVYGNKHSFKDYLITNYDIDIVIDDNTAVFLDLEGGKSKIDYSPEVLGKKTSGEVRPANGVLGTFYFAYRDGKPFIRVDWNRLTCQCRKRVRICQRCKDSRKEYRVRHADLQVRIVDKDAAFFVPRKGKYERDWDGILDYTSKSMQPA